MNDAPFRNLASAREEYAKLTEELAEAKANLARRELLEADNSDLQVQLDAAQKTMAEQAETIGARDESLGALDKLIEEKNRQIKALEGSLEVANLKCSQLEKGQKSVQAEARELVAAAAGPPAPVDNSEMEMTQDDLVRAMRTETGPKLSALYRQYKKQQAEKS